MTSAVMDSREADRNANSFLLTGALGWLSHGDYPIDVSRPAPCSSPAPVFWPTAAGSEAAQSQKGKRRPAE